MDPRTLNDISPWGVGSMGSKVPRFGELLTNIGERPREIHPQMRGLGVLGKV